jgi:cytochrome c oxidase subunit IV
LGGVNHEHSNTEGAGVSDHHSHPEEHIPPTTHATDHPHPTAKTYVGIAIILSVVTAVEIAIVYVPFLRPILTALLLILGAAKFFLVVAFYMHLRFDSKLYTTLFFLGMAFAVAILLALVVLYYLFHPHY